MTIQISFTKDATLQNILFDEFFAEHQSIEVVAFNYDGAGTALCRCDGDLAEIHKANLRKIIFGSDKATLEAYLQGVFNPDVEAEEIHRQNDTPVFRLAALNQMKRYDVANLAKKTLQEVQDHGANPFRYYTRDPEAPIAGEPKQAPC